MELLQENKQKMALDIFSSLLGLGNLSEDELLRVDYKDVPLYQQLEDLCSKQKKLVFILPAFPAKSANTDKTSGVLPDLGELIGLVTLDQFCGNISQIYSPGAEVVVCSDGRVFNDLVFVSNKDLQSYKLKITEIIKKHNLGHIKTYDLDDYYGACNFEDMRVSLCTDHADDLENIKDKVKTDENFKGFFNGIHRFLKEDMLNLKSELSKNQITKQSKNLAYQVIQRSGAWDKLLKSKFPETLRLSIHPYPITHHKFGVKLVPSSNRWATPWHNVVLKRDDQFELVKKSEAIALGAIEKKWGGEYVYFE
jgi:pyoverdine/dityrosine biosynthesis protein Dit1